MFGGKNTWLSRGRARGATPRTRRKHDETLGHAADKSKTLNYILLATMWLVCLAAVVSPKQTGGAVVHLVPNQLAPETIYAAFDFKFEDTKATADKMASARAAVPLVFLIDEEASQAMIRNAEAFMQLLASGWKKGSATPPAGGDAATKALDFANSLPQQALDDISIIFKNANGVKAFAEKYAAAVYQGILKSSDADRLEKDALIQLIDKSERMRAPTSASRIGTNMNVADKVAKSVSKEYAPQNRELLEKSLYEAVYRLLDGNLVYDKEQTEVLRNAAADAPENKVFKQIAKEDIIINKNSIVSSELVDCVQKYETARHAKSQEDIWQKLSLGCVNSLIVAFLAFYYLRQIHPDVLASNQKLGVAVTVAALGVAAILGVELAFNTLASVFYLPRTLQSCALPLGLAPVLLGTLVGFRGALFVSLFIALAAAMRYENYAYVILGLGVGGVAANASSSAANYKTFYVRSAFAITACTLLIEYLVMGAWSLPGMIQQAKCVLICCSNGIVTASAALIALFLLESVFKISTNMSLLAFADYNHPLLRRLQLEAPGTFHHSLVVATLAEQAANAISANPIRTRVCALYHDVGKLAKPEYFGENNIDGEDVHRDLNPRLSSLVILSHVKEGADLAIKHKLRRIIQDAIQQHHGTDLVYYFYKKAVEGQTPDDGGVDEDDYRYPGPKPRRKEIVIVSLADACEAASRALAKPNAQKIEALVWDIIRTRLKDGQLDEAEITVGELADVRVSFTKTLSSMLHPRIGYPKRNLDGDENRPVKDPQDPPDDPPPPSRPND